MGDGNTVAAISAAEVHELQFLVVGKPLHLQTSSFAESRQRELHCLRGDEGGVEEKGESEVVVGGHAFLFDGEKM